MQLNHPQQYPIPKAASVGKVRGYCTYIDRTNVDETILQHDLDFIFSQGLDRLSYRMGRWMAE